MVFTKVLSIQKLMHASKTSDIVKCCFDIMTKYFENILTEFRVIGRRTLESRIESITV